MRRFRLLMILLLAVAVARAQDSCHLRISLLTCSPGEELYSTFGHSALRLQDLRTGMDIIFNYGTFDFDDPDFYTKFTKGKLNYFLSVESFRDFKYAYTYEQRGIIEQTLNLTCAEKEAMVQKLRINSQEANRYYKYDFLFDNCTTRLRDLIEDGQTPAVTFKNILPTNPPSFRNMLHSYLDKGGQYWSKLGIDILLGSIVDKKADNRQAMFLPDYLMKALDSASIDGRPLVATTRTILKGIPVEAATPWWQGPALVFSLLFILILLLQVFNTPVTRNIIRVFDVIYFLLLGAVGCLLVFMWFGTDHQVCQTNYNLLWALPTHLPAAFFLNSQKKWVKKYFGVIFVETVILLLTWLILPQQLNPALIPLVLIILMRTFHLRKAA